MSTTTNAITLPVQFAQTGISTWTARAVVILDPGTLKERRTAETVATVQRLDGQYKISYQASPRWHSLRRTTRYAKSLDAAQARILTRGWA